MSAEPTRLAYLNSIRADFVDNLTRRSTAEIAALRAALVQAQSALAVQWLDEFVDSMSEQTTPRGHVMSTAPTMLAIVVSRWNASKVLYQCEAPEGLRRAIEKAVDARVDLSGANLHGADWPDPWRISCRPVQRSTP